MSTGSISGNMLIGDFEIPQENHLITINYSSINETVTSARPIGDEFPGLSSNLVDPITAAFYDRHTNQIYFFKGKFLQTAIVTKTQVQGQNLHLREQVFLRQVCTCFYLPEPIMR